MRPDSIAVAARIESGAEIAIQVASVPSQPTGTRLEIYGREGALFLTARSANIGPDQLHGARGGDALEELAPPDEYVVGAGGGRRPARRGTWHRRTRGWQMRSEQVSPSTRISTSRSSGIDCWRRSSAPRRRARRSRCRAKPRRRAGTAPASRRRGRCRGPGRAAARCCRSRCRAALSPPLSATFSGPTHSRPGTTFRDVAASMISAIVLGSRPKPWPRTTGMPAASAVASM